MTIKVLKKLAAALSVFAVLSCYFCAEAVEPDSNWDETILSKWLECDARRLGKDCNDLCETRIRLLNKIVSNVLFMPCDVKNYEIDGWIYPNSYEILKLLDFAGVPCLKEDQWKDKINKLIAAYRSIQSKLPSAKQQATA